MKKKLKSGKIDILIGQDGTTINIFDDEANITFAVIKLTPEQLSKALSRLSRTSCEIEVMGLDKVGKTMEHKTHEFEIPETVNFDNKHEALSELIKETLPEGWISDNYFSSQKTFFTRDGKKFAQTTIRRWV